MKLNTQSDPSNVDDELAAAIVAVELLLAEEAANAMVEQPAPPDGWRNSAKLIAQRMYPAKTATARWNTIERLRRGI